MPAYRIQAPQALAVPLALAKTSLRVTHDLRDAEITAWLRGLILEAEQRTGQCFMQQKWRLELPYFASYISVPHPVISIDKFQYIDSAGVARDVTDADYVLLKGQFSTILVPKPNGYWPSTMYRGNFWSESESETHYEQQVYPTELLLNRLVLEVTAGYGTDPALMPEALTPYVLARLAENLDPVTRVYRNTAATQYVDRALDALKSYR